jgi:hypothetical protein
MPQSSASAYFPSSNKFRWGMTLTRSVLSSALATVMSTVRPARSGMSSTKTGPPFRGPGATHVVNWDFRFGPPTRAHRTLLLPSTQRNLSLDQAPAKVARSDGQYCASDEPGLPPRHRFLGHLTVPPSVPQTLQPQSVCYPFGTGSAQIRRSIWPNMRRCRCPSANINQ